MNRKSENRSDGQPAIRCAIYTRKSTEEGLEQEFNSLDAQREAAEAYISSQKHEGWVYLSDHYDDGGFSGGNLERPALKRLMGDVEAGKIDCIVVYKVDRLSRSLLDFARIMDVFDQQGVSFVSVTQQFNTTNSMGRLTLNVLLSFAQFEREIIAERTRDKMSAARRKGKWVGGMPVLGYDIDPKGGRLLLNDDEATKVRAIFQLYLEYQSLLATAKELNERGWTTKRWITKKEKARGGKPFDKNILSRLLTNIIYIGKVRYQGTIYDGEHPAILEEDVWREVQNRLKRNGRTGGKAVRNKYGALLKGLIYCAPCKAAMVHSYTAKKNKRYRYYVCTKAQKQGWDTCPTKSLPALEIERFVVNRIRSIGTDPELVSETLMQIKMQSQSRNDELTREEVIVSRDIRKHTDEIKRLVGSMTADHDGGSPATARLADLQDRIRTAEQRGTQIREELLTINRELVDEDEMIEALSLFDPVWDSLTPREQARMLHLLVERVGYDGEKETVSITFRPTGIKSLAEELKVNSN